MASCATGWSPKGAEDSAGVKPARAVFGKDFFPVDVAGLQLRDGSMSAVGTDQRGAHSESAFGEIQAHCGRYGHAVKRHPADQI